MLPKSARRLRGAAAASPEPRPRLVKGVLVFKGSIGDLGFRGLVFKGLGFRGLGLGV